MNIDPLAEKFHDMSPFNYTMNNPVFFIDPDGRSTAPIYDTNGEFLGTDNEGLTGKAIVMESNNFTQGMSHEDALSNSLGKEGLSSTQAETNLMTHYDGLSSRPDYDGVVTLGEANDWARNGNGQPLYVDIGKLDLSRVSVWGDFAEFDSSTRDTFSNEQLSEKNYKWKNSIFFNFALPGAGSGKGQDPGPVFGTLKLSLLNRETGDVQIGNSRGRLDVYDFESHQGRHFRNALTWIGRQLATQLGTSTITTYEIYGYGKNQVSTGF